MTPARIDRAAAALRETLPVFTRGNLFHAATRSSPTSRAAFDAALGTRLKRGPIEGLLLGGPAQTRGIGLAPREQHAYYPAAILLVDRRDLVDLFAASGALIQARTAVVDVRGYPAPVVRWLIAGARAGHRAPVGYLHDESTVLYPFAFEPLATLARVSPALQFRDLGLRPGKGFRDPHTRMRVHDIEAVTPAALVAFALRTLIDMIAPDLMLAPRRT